MRRLRIALAGLSLTCAAAAFAGEHGSLRFTVLNRNPAHTTSVQLNLNGKSFAAFSHAQHGAIVKDVSADFLAKGKSTPLSSDYGKLQDDCEFDFTIEYSFNGTAWIPLGKFHAPGQSVNSSLPLGLCDGSLCSGDPTVSAKLEQIEQERWEKAGQALRDWLQAGIDSEAKAREAQARRLHEQARANIVAQKSAEAAERARREMELREQAAQDAALQPDAASELDKQIAAAADEAQLEKMAADLDRAEKFYKACAEQGTVTLYYCTRYGGMGWLVATAEAMATLLVADPEAALVNLNAKISGYNPAAALDARMGEIAQSKLRIQQAVDARRFEERWREVAAAARAGVAFSPLNDVADLCEFLTGRELCYPGGRVLGRDERLFAAMGVVLGNRVLWNEISAEFKAGLLNRFKDPAAAVKAVERMAELAPDFDARGLTHILAGETRVVNGGTRLVSGMHTEEAISAFLSDLKNEGRALEIRPIKSNAELLSTTRVEGQVLHYRDQNGVGLYLLPESAFASAEAFKNSGAQVTVNGKANRILGAKTSFPPNWDHRKVVEALDEGRNNPTLKISAFRYQAKVDGVEMSIAIDGAGKVTRGSFPYVDWTPPK